MIDARVFCRRVAYAAAILVCAASVAASAADVGGSLAQKGNGNGAPACMTCHGPSGEGNAAAGFPRLAGLGKAYIERQLEAFANGQRQNPVMAPIAKALAPAERSATAAYYARLPFAHFRASATASGAGAKLATEGRWERGLVPGCVQCHGPNGMGVGDQFPPLAGQSPAYIAEQLRAWQKGTRPPGPLQLMQVVASKLSGEDVEAVAAYFGGMQPMDPAGKGKP